MDPKVLGILLALLSAAFFSIFNTSIKLFLKKSTSTLAYSGLYQIVSALAFLVLFPFDRPRAELTPENIFFVVLMIILYSLFNAFGIISNKLLDISITGILSQITLVFTFFGSIIIFRENDNFLIKVIGVLLILVANVLVVSASQRTGKKKSSIKGIIFRLIACLCIAMAMMVDAKISNKFSLSVYGFIANLVPGIIILLAIRITPAKLLLELKSNTKGIMITALAGTLGYTCLLSSYALAPKSVVTSLYNLTAIFIVIIGIVYFKERTSLRIKIFSVLLAFLGAFVISNV